MIPTPTPGKCGAQHPGNPWLSHTVRIIGKRAEIPDVSTYDLAFTNPEVAANYHFQPGQFNMLYLPGAGEVAISISADPQSQGTWAHTIRVAGNVTHCLNQLSVGSTLGLRGPYGSNWPVMESVGQDVILVAGGIGLAPLRPTIYHILANREQYGSVTLLLGARTPSGLMYPAEYQDWTAAGLEIDMTVDRADDTWTGHVGVVTLLLDRLPRFHPEQTLLMTCGPEIMMHFTARSALKRGLAPSRIWLSWERNMQCAVGLCGHCQWGSQFVCKDGPVFRYDRIQPFLNLEGL